MKNIHRNLILLLLALLGVSGITKVRALSPSDSLIQAGAERLLDRFENYAQLVERDTYTEASAQNFLSLFADSAMIILGLTPDGFSDELVEPSKFYAFAMENFPSGLIVKLTNRELIEINHTERLVILNVKMEVSALTNTGKWAEDSFDFTFTITYNPEATQFLINSFDEKIFERESLDFEFRNVSRNDQPVRNLTVFLEWERGRFTEKTGDDGIVRFENIPMGKQLKMRYDSTGFETRRIPDRTAEEWLSAGISRVINLTEKRVWTGWSFEGYLLPASTGISAQFDNKNYSYSTISTSSGFKMNLGATGAYFFSRDNALQLGLKSGIEVFSARADITYGSIDQNRLNHRDAGNDDYMFLLTANSIGETVNLIILNIPIILEGRFKTNFDKIPFIYAEVGVSFGFPVSFTSNLKGSYTSSGLYEQYNNLIIHSQPQLGFYTNMDFELEQTQKFDPSLLTSFRTGVGVMINTGFRNTYLKTGFDLAMGINGAIEGNPDSYYFITPGSNPDSPLRSTDKFDVYWLSLKLGIVYDLFK